MGALRWLSCSPWEFRACLAVPLLIAFYGGIANKVLISDVGRPWAHHAALILLLVTPWWWAQTLGVVCYADDIVNHGLKRFWPSFQSPLHKLGFPLYYLRDQIGYRLPEGKIRDWLLTL